MSTQLKKLLVEKLIEGKPIIAKGLQLTRQSMRFSRSDMFTLNIIDEKGGVLVTIGSFPLENGDQVTILDLDKVFNVTVACT